MRLAVAILKDRDGKIILDVPIEGSLDDPKFRIGKVVVRVIVNILEKVATSPFSLLGAAFGGGGEEMSYQDFTPGSAELSPVGRQKLDSLAKGLYARPALQLEISGSVDLEADREGLQRAALDHEIRTRLWQKLRDSQRATNSVDQIALSPDDRADWINKIYAEALANGRITPALIAANTNLAAYAAQVLPHSTGIPSEIPKDGALLIARTTEQTPDTNAPAYLDEILPRRPARWKPSCWQLIRLARAIWKRSLPTAPRLFNFTCPKPARWKPRVCSSPPKARPCAPTAAAPTCNSADPALPGFNAPSAGNTAPGNFPY